MLGRHRLCPTCFTPMSHDGESYGCCICKTRIFIPLGRSHEKNQTRFAAPPERSAHVLPLLQLYATQNGT